MLIAGMQSKTEHNSSCFQEEKDINHILNNIIKENLPKRKKIL